ncbi:Uncharacterised protein [Leclercia adecarboxylata]|uniref:D-ribose-binding periplasmic protein n=1 Tax=Leclercia adecarboxylata TaxID=83655 RepID=A0A4U9HF84_9ENTR|nr:Uncharacterised protein [Leclercia adecarboxylata]
MIRVNARSQRICGQKDDGKTLREEYSMRLKPLVTALCAGALLAASPFVQAKELKSIGVTVGDLANPFFVQITKGAELEARKLAGG